MHTWHYLPYHFRGTLLPALAFIALLSSLKSMAMEILLKSNDGIIIPINQCKTNLQIPLVQHNTLFSRHQSSNALTITIPYNEIITNKFVSLLDKSVFEPENPIIKHEEFYKKIEQLPLQDLLILYNLGVDGLTIPKGTFFERYLGKRIAEKAVDLPKKDKNKLVVEDLGISTFHVHYHPVRILLDIPISKYKWVTFITKNGQHISMSQHLAQWSSFIQNQIETFNDLENIIIDFSLSDRPHLTDNALQACIELFNKLDEWSQISNPFYEFDKNIQPIESLLEKKTLKDLIDIINCLDALGLVCDFNNIKSNNNMKARCVISQAQKTIIKQLASIKDTTEQTDAIQYTKNHLNPTILCNMASHYKNWQSLHWAWHTRCWMHDNKSELEKKRYSTLNHFQQLIIWTYIGPKNQDQEFFDQYFSIAQDLFAGLLTPQNNSWFFNFKNPFKWFFAIMTAISIVAAYKLHAN